MKRTTTPVVPMLLLSGVLLCDWILALPLLAADVSCNKCTYTAQHICFLNCITNPGNCADGKPYTSIRYTSLFIDICQADVDWDCRQSGNVVCALAFYYLLDNCPAGGQSPCTLEVTTVGCDTDVIREEPCKAG